MFPLRLYKTKLTAVHQTWKPTFCSALTYRSLPLWQTLTDSSRISHIIHLGEGAFRQNLLCNVVFTFVFLSLSLSVSAGVVSRNSEPQPKAWPDCSGLRTGLLPGDRPAESSRHPLQERVREGNGWWWIDSTGENIRENHSSEPQNKHF